MKKFIKLWWRSFLIFSMPVAAILCILCALAADSESMVPAYVGLVSGAWLLLLVIANDPYRGKEEEDEIRATKDDFIEL